MLLAAVQDAGWARADIERWRLVIGDVEVSAHPQALHAKAAAERHYGEPLLWEQADEHTWMAWSHRE